MKTIIIGLGNPGEKFENTRHNIGFNALNLFVKENNFPEFILQKKANALISSKGDILLVKPQTFMNESGKAVKEIIENKNMQNLIVVHDDMDLPVGKIKIIQERGSAGHKGVESIIKSIGNKDLIRIRVGIRPVSEGKGYPIFNVANKIVGVAKQLVLKKFSKTEQKLVDKILQKTVKAIKFLSENGLEKAMNEYN